MLNIIIGLLMYACSIINSPDYVITYERKYGVVQGDYEYIGYVLKDDKQYHVVIMRMEEI